LVYVRTQPDAVVLVQYKRLSYAASGEPYFRDDRRLTNQLQRMLAYRSDPDEAASLLDHRLASEFAFVKFLDDQTTAGLADNEVTSGSYLPATYVVDMLDRGPQGPRGGRVYYVRRERGIDSAVFVSLVREGWLGSRGDVTSLLRQTLRVPEYGITLAVDESRRS
jgi:hypothetical protein